MQDTGSREVANNTFDRTAGSRSLATAGQRERSPERGRLGRERVRLAEAPEGACETNSRP